MKTSLFIITSLMCFYLNSNAQLWELQNSGTGQELLHTQFVNINTGFASGYNGTLLKTTNGGLNWNALTGGPTGFIKSLFFIDANTGWAAGGTTSNGQIFKTTNGGNSWVSQVSGYSDYFDGLFFLNSNLGWTTTVINSEVNRTTNGGQTWIPLTSGEGGISYSLIFIDANTGWWGRQGYIRKTTNGGLNWVNQHFEYGSYWHEVQFLNANTGWAVGESAPFAKILKTTNGGNNWTEQLNNVNGAVHSIQFLNANTGWAGGKLTDYYATLLMKTTDGGVTWVQNQNNQSLPWIWDIHFPSSDTGWAVGGAGTIYKTPNGSIGITTISTKVPEGFSLSQNYPNPFNPKTLIRFSLPVAGMTSLKVYDILGREIAIIVNEQLKPGTYEVDFDGSRYSSGIYFYSLEAGDFRQTLKMVLVK